MPRVMRGAVGLTPLTVFIAILAGTEFAGIPGALLAIPTPAVIRSCCRTLPRRGGRRTSRAIGAAGLALDARLNLTPGLLSVDSANKQ